MQFSTLQNWIKSTRLPASLLFSAVLCFLFFSCAVIPVQEQLVSATRTNPLTRTNGNCAETAAVKQQPGAMQAGLSPDSISIFNWNIYKEQRQNWDVDLLRLSHEKDIILLQEAALNPELQEVLQQKNLYWNLNSAFKYKGSDTGVLVASTIQDLESCGLRNSEPLIGLPKTILISRYNITDSSDELLVATIHGINISLGTGAYQEQLDSLQSILKNHDGPIILAGDFNNWSKKRTDIMVQLAADLSLQILSFAEESRTLFFGDPVDQILYRGLEPVSHIVHPVASSDHNPISVTFRLTRSKTDHEPALTSIP
ncbi:MAG: endonuclease/exonuclease/phosphatase family protein [Proteobacteria bacterium]|nr:endonuclease/exonuclease/phosphatase family protein [Pseudomonadota bacterium]MBU1455411.1 endonuclease/exonuclease/phosphatase family protein [Pseudomonadota bacterium]